MTYEHKNGGKIWVLHSKVVTLRNVGNRTFYFFTKKGKEPASGRPCDMPIGKAIGINPRTGLPFLKNT